MIDVVEQKLMDRISEVEMQLATLNNEMKEYADNQNTLYKLRTIYTGLNKNVTELLRYLTSIQIAKYNTEDSSPTNPDVVFKGSREDLLKELRMKKQIEQESINDELPNDEPEHAFDEPEDTIKPILQPTKKEDMKMKRALYGVY